MALDFIAGMFGGAAGVVVGHPFDTIKVSGFYKGVASPLAGLAAINAIVFGVYGNTLKKLERPDSVKSQALAGAMAGLAQSFISSPMELVKLKLQLQVESCGSSVKYLNTFHCARVVLEEFGFRGIFRGLYCTIWRDVTGFAIYFASYETITRALKRRRNGSDAPASELLFAGGMAGTMSWALNYPMDVIKTRFQCAAPASCVSVDKPAYPRTIPKILSPNFLETGYEAAATQSSRATFATVASSYRADGHSAAAQEPGYRTVRECILRSYRTEGLRVFTQGLFPTLLRAFPTNAVTFFTVASVFRCYEWWFQTTAMQVEGSEPDHLIHVEGSEFEKELIACYTNFL